MKTVTTAELWTVPRRLRDPLIGIAGMLVLLIGAALVRRGGAPVHLSPFMVIHLVTVVPAVPLGALVLFRRKGGRTHRRLGYVWVALMMVTAASSFGIHELTGRLSPIHLFSVITLVGLPLSIRDARAGRIGPHRRRMLIVYASLVIAGLFTMLPSRLLGHWLLG